MERVIYDFLLILAGALASILGSAATVVLRMFFDYKKQRARDLKDIESGVEIKFSISRDALMIYLKNNCPSTTVRISDDEAKLVWEGFIKKDGERSELAHDTLEFYVGKISIFPGKNEFVSQCHFDINDHLAKYWEEKSGHSWAFVSMKLNDFKKPFHFHAHQISNDSEES